MELLLNLLWLLLAVPATWLWRRDLCARGLRPSDSWRCVLSLGCMLVVLFPVVSATDDLHAMRSEMEESSPSKRAVKSGSGNSALSATGGATGNSIASTIFFLSLPGDQSCSLVPAASTCVPEALHFGYPEGRAPPTSFLS